MKSRLTGAFVLVLIISSASACFAATDLCKQYAVDKEYDKAIEECTRQITGEVTVKYLEFSYSNRGAAYAKKSQYNEAISDYTKAIELNPGYTTAYYNRAIAKANRGLYDEAISDFSKVLALNPVDSTAYVGRATVYANRKQFDQAISDYSKAIELNPEDSVAYHNRAMVYASKKQFDQAVSDRNRAIQLSVPEPSRAAPANLPAARQARKAIYHVQLGVFKDEHNASSLVKRLRKKGYDAFVIKSPVRNKGTLHRVLIGKFEDRQESEKAANKVKKKEKITTTIFSE